VGAFKFAGPGFEISVFLQYLRAHFLQPLDVEIDGAAADGTSAGHGHAGHSGAGHQRAQDEGTGAHGFNDFVFGFGAGESSEVDAGDVVGGAGTQFDLRTHRYEQFALGFDVADLGNVFERDFVFSKDGGGHAGERGVLGA
jgi:hypothetical protein